MSDWEIVRRQVAIAGRVTDARTGKPIGGARVEIADAPDVLVAQLALKARQHGVRWDAMPERPDRARTAADGYFHFLDLPDGDYTLVAWLPGARTRYGRAETTATVSRDAENRVALATADLRLPQLLFAPKLGSEFVPTQIPDCWLWLTPETIAGLGDGDPVARWPDRSGNGHDAEQLGAGKQPTYRVTGIGSRPAVEFDGADDFLTLSFSEESTDHTFIFVCDQKSLGGHRNYLFDAQAGRLSLDAAEANPPHNLRWHDETWRKVAMAVTGPQMLTWVFSGRIGQVFRNGASLGRETYTPRSLGGMVTLGANCSGRYGRFDGMMAEVVYYNRALPPEERQQVERYLSERFSIPLDE